MASGYTNKGKFRELERTYRGGTIPTNYFVALVTGATTPGPDTNTMSDLTQIAAGNGYTSGGISLNKNSTDFDTLTEDDLGDLARILLRDLVWTAAGGPIPASGSGARWAPFTDDNVTVGSREVYAYWDLAADRTVSAGQTLTLQDCELRLTE